MQNSPNDFHLSSLRIPLNVLTLTNGTLCPLSIVPNIDQFIVS